MEEQLNALALGAGARVAETLLRARAPLRWRDLYAALEHELGSRGTLTKTLRRLMDAGLVEKLGDAYSLRHEDAIRAVLDRAAQLDVAVQRDRLTAAERRLRDLRVAAVPDVEDEAI